MFVCIILQLWILDSKHTANVMKKDNDAIVSHIFVVNVKAIVVVVVAVLLMNFL